MWIVYVCCDWIVCDGQVQCVDVLCQWDFVLVQYWCVYVDVGQFLFCIFGQKYGVIGGQMQIGCV